MTCCAKALDDDLDFKKWCKCWSDNPLPAVSAGLTAQEEQAIDTHSTRTNGGPIVKSRNAVSRNTM